MSGKRGWSSARSTFALLNWSARRIRVRKRELTENAAHYPSPEIYESTPYGSYGHDRRRLQLIARTNPCILSRLPAVETR